MTLIVEDGTIVAGAESYLSVADADSYWSKLNDATWTGSSAVKEAALRAATQYIDATYRFASVIQTTTQDLQWPRSGFSGRTGRMYNANTIPTCLKAATAELAKEYVVNGALLPSADRGGDIKRVKAGSVEVEYMDKASNKKTYDYVSRLLSDVTSGMMQGVSAGLQRV